MLVMEAIPGIGGDVTLGQQDSFETDRPRRGQNSSLQVLREVPAFRLLLSGQLVSQLGDALNELALMWLVLELTGSAVKMGAVMIAYLIPEILFSLPAGAMVDRLDRRRVLIAADLVRAVVIGMVPAMAAFGWLRFEGLLAVSFLMSLVSTFFGPAKTAYIQVIVPRDLLLGANGLSQISWQAASLLGPAVGGMAVAWMGAANVILLDAISFLVSAIMIAAIRVPGRAHEGEGETSREEGRDEPETRRTGGMWADVIDGLKFVVGQKALFYLIVIAWVVNFAAAPLVVLTPLFVKEVLHQGPAAFGFVNAAFSAGMLAGGFVIGSLRSWRRTILIFGGLFASGIGFAGVGLSQALWQTMAAFAFAGVANTIQNATFGTWLQEMVPNDKMGRVWAAVSAGVSAASPLSLAMSGLLADNLSLRFIYLGMAAVFVASGAIGLRARVFKAFNAPAPASQDANTAVAGR